MTTELTHNADDFDSDIFRAVLGNYPTGVVVVTAMSDGEPVGMVIGSFTSVSLDPPLVAFLPTKTSSTFKRIRQASSFCVNVLSGDQEPLCRDIFARGSDALADMTLRSAPSGAPILQGGVAWIDCEPEQMHEAGDHYIVVGLVRAMGVEREGLPLLFFQGGYGRFAPGSLVLERGGHELVASVQRALDLRHHLEQLAESIQCECSVVALDGDEGVFVASAAASGLAAAAPIGARLPVAAPLQGLFVSEDGPITPQRWLASLGRDQEAKQEAMAALDRIRARGWSLTVYVGDAVPDIDAVVRDYASCPRTPSRERAYLATVTALPLLREPEEIDPSAFYMVSDIAVAIPDPSGKVPPMVIKLGQLPGPVTGSRVLDWIASLRAMCQAVSGASGSPAPSAAPAPSAVS